MDLVTTSKVLMRHWLLTAVAVVAAIGVSAIVYVKVPTTYLGNALVLLQAPPSGALYHPAQPGSSVKPTPPTESNPYLSVDSSLWVMARVVATDLTGDSVKSQVQDEGLTLNYQVTAQVDVPAIGISVTDHDRNRIVVKLHQLISLVAADMRARQQATGAPADTWATPIASAVPLTIDRTKDKLKMVIAVAVVSLGIAIGLVFVVESIQAGLRRRERSRLMKKLEELRAVHELEALKQVEPLPNIKPIEVQQYG